GRIRDWAERVTKRKNLQTLLYFMPFLIITTGLQFPLIAYEGYFREHKYGLSNQTFGPWFGEQMIGLALTAVLGGIVVMVLVALVRRLGETWWIWAAVVSVIFLACLIVISPVFIAPLFNKYTKLQDPRIKDPILSMAHAHWIPA